MVRRGAARFVKIAYLIGAPKTSVSAIVMQLRLETKPADFIWHVLTFFSIGPITRCIVELWSSQARLHPVPRHQPAARSHSQQFQRLQLSVVCGLPTSTLSFQEPSLPGMLSQRIELMEAKSLQAFDQAPSAVTPVAYTCVYTTRVFLHLFQFQFIYVSVIKVNCK